MYDTGSGLIERLCDPSVYPHECTAEIRVEETHSAWVILTGAFAYKIKKPVNFGFLDFSTLAKRKRFCQRELILNRERAPEIYLDVITIRENEHSIAFGGAHGKAIEYAVKMRQFSEESLLTNLVRQNQLTDSYIDQLADSIAKSHIQAKKAPQKSAFGSPDLIQYWMEECFTHISEIRIPDDEKSALKILKSWCVDQHRALEKVFLRRKLDEKICDCHGDLHLNNLVLIRGKIIPFDRIEFNDALRWIDPINEIAFLVMDLAEHGSKTSAYRFVNRYLQTSGDYLGLPVLTYYLIYRALVRAKVSALRREQFSPTSVEYRRQTEECRQYIHYAEESSKVQKGKLIITYGFSGSGKSFVAERISEHLGMIQIRSDLERKRISDQSFNHGKRSKLQAGNYLPEKTDAVYSHLLVLADAVLSAGYSVILDATFLQKKHRDKARELARMKSLPFCIIFCSSTKDVLLQRIQQRNARGLDASEATEAVLYHQLASEEKIEPDEQKYVVEADASSDAALNKTLRRMNEALKSDPG